MRILVTGGTGLLGNNVLRQLRASEHELVALVRSKPEESVFAGIDCRLERADVIDKDAVSAAVSGCDAVIHSAGLIQLGWSRFAESMKVNRDGTAYLVKACLENKCPLVYVGTVNTLAVGCKSGPSDEQTPLSHEGGQIPCSYIVSKRAGVEEVEKGVGKGMKAVIVHPGFMLGPWDWKPSSGRMMLEVGKSWRPVAPTGGCSVCDARDVAAGTIAAMQCLVDNEIPSGRHFILAGYNRTYMELWREFADRMGRLGPAMPAGPLMRILGGWLGDAITAVSGRELDINSAAIRMSSQYHWHSSERARRELGYKNRPLEQTLESAAEWLKARFMQASDSVLSLPGNNCRVGSSYSPE